MKKLVFLFLLFISYLDGFCQENISFPLEIGNKFFYKTGHYPDNGYYGAIKTITDQFSDSTWAINFEKYYLDSINISQEYWRFWNKKLYVSSTTTYFGSPVYDGNFSNDTCIYIGLPSTCYKLFNISLFNQDYNCQSFSDGHFSHGSGNSVYIITANNLGIYFSYWTGFGIGLDIRDSIKLVGFINNETIIGDTILTDVGNPNIIVKTFQLYQNYPNPFNPSTTINYQIPQRSLISLKVYDILGREVATFVNEEKPAGNYKVEFNGNSLSSGIYFYKLQTGNYSSVKKMILMK